MWQGLMDWAEEARSVQRRHVEETYAQRNIRGLLAEDALDDLNVDDFNRLVWRYGAIVTPEGQPVDTSGLSPHEVEARLSSGDWEAVGNLTVGSATHIWGTPLKADDQDKPGILRAALRELLYSGGNAYERFERANRLQAGLSDNSLTLILCMLEPQTMGIMNTKSREGVRRLARLLGVEQEWQSGINGGYQSFNDLLREIHEKSDGILSDMLMVDAFLWRLTESPDAPRHWKVALAMYTDEADELYDRAIRHHFAAVKGGEPDDNDAAFRDVMPGDYVVMHRERRIAAVGRVTRPYYEIKAPDLDAVDEKWYRRIGVQWLPGEHDYGAALPGAKQRRTVIDLDEGIFWWLAEKYADAPQFDEVLNPPDDWRDLIREPDDHNAWIFQGNPDLWTSMRC